MNAHAYTELVRNAAHELARLLSGVDPQEQVDWIEYVEWLLGLRSDDFDDFAHAEEWLIEDEPGSD